MKAPLQNVRRLALLKRTLAIAPAVILPLGITGVTVRPALDLREAQMEEHRLELLLEHCRERRRALEEFGPLEQVEVFDTLRQRLRGLVPSTLEPIEIYSHVRHAARVVGVELTAIRLADPIDMEWVIDGETIARRPVSVAGEAPLDQLAGFIAGLDASGLPLAVTRLSVGRDRRDQVRFRFELELGLFYLMPAGSVDPAADDDETNEQMPTGS